jgi:heme/copper-type cytochrome/quinol oxidase subunit 3
MIKFIVDIVITTIIGFGLGFLFLLAQIHHFLRGIKPHGLTITISLFISKLFDKIGVVVKKLIYLL